MFLIFLVTGQFFFFSLKFLQLWLGNKTLFLDPFLAFFFFFLKN